MAIKKGWLHLPLFIMLTTLSGISVAADSTFAPPDVDFKLSGAAAPATGDFNCPAEAAFRSCYDPADDYSVSFVKILGRDGAGSAKIEISGTIRIANNRVYTSVLTGRVHVNNYPNATQWRNFSLPASTLLLSGKEAGTTVLKATISFTVGNYKPKLSIMPFDGDKVAFNYSYPYGNGWDGELNFVGAN